ncbi:hypothetical protein [Tahibacter soli]|uniref:Uncharacterized protein n=1 Tax=Tahibacter soli TaxID=2983605 RepID=A0A9X3YFQ3_9GAMM|nr:hypothetical protein [Tahibacter soli]MDC8011121.1 hypothetical protein [Tahibacter soli]
MGFSLSLVIPAQAGIQLFDIGENRVQELDSGLRRNDEQKAKAGFQLSLE